MALSIHTNYSSLVTQTNLTKTNNALGTTQQRLGTGLRINSAADDAAGLQIATRLNANSRGMAVALRNTSDAVSLLQTSEGAFDEMTNIVLRMKDLLTQGASDTNGTSDRAAMQAEYDELGKELANVVKNTTYAGTALFSDGTLLTGAGGKLSTAVDFQIGSAAGEKLTMNLGTQMSAVATALTALTSTYSVPGTAGTELGTTSGATANGNITKAVTAMDAITKMRGLFGANINRLNHTASNLSNMKDNTDMAKGRIMDADFAQESANMTKNSMLLQSGISMLKQAGQMPGMVMSLLG